MVKIQATVLLLSAGLSLAAVLPIPPIGGFPPSPDTIILTSLTRSTYAAAPTPRPREVVENELPPVVIPIPGGPAPPVNTIILTSLTRTSVDYAPTPRPRAADLEERADLPPIVIPFPGAPPPPDTIFNPTVTRTTYGNTPTIRPREPEDAEPAVPLPPLPPVATGTIIITSLTRITPKPGPTITRITPKPGPTITRITVPWPTYTRP
ncbi:hypothetical protein FA13DRAFT_710207 [Coprinellus micaceus]|uniref:Uncharacterized protein n=1 Tax=Coprinellus micaceus TaxID=71717 RepID=A0A4Y7TUQ4_COPMI|nr:hypothetical protein FA13DRAFT_710207 [Coprinellus micaceus]